jgi:hypothetical protein
MTATVSLDQPDGVIGRSGFGQHLEPFFAIEDEPQPTPDHGVVVGQDDGDPVSFHGQRC